MGKNKSDKRSVKKGKQDQDKKRKAVKAKSSKKTVDSSKSKKNESALLKALKQDPFAKREAEKYENPIPSREFIMQRLGQLDKPATANAIIRLMGVKDAAQKEAMGYRLKAMQRDGQLIKDRRNRLALVNKTDLIKGVVEATPNGYGFLTGEQIPDSLFINPRQMRRVFPGDLVLACRTVDYSGRDEGIIVEVLGHSIQYVVGCYQIEYGVALVKPLNPSLSVRTMLVAPAKKHTAKIGDLVLAEIIQYPDQQLEAVVEIKKVWGKELDAKSVVDFTLYSSNIPSSWSEAVLAELNPLKDIPIAGESARREDLRKVPLVTIDGDDSKDFDDAVAALPDGDGWKLVVAIADVAAYVKEGSALDRAARERGNSIYFPGKKKKTHGKEGEEKVVVPMLPSLLSDDLCSLMPKKDRLAVAVTLRLSAEGKVLDYRFCEALIRSKARLTYDQVYQYLEGQKAKGSRSKNPAWGDDVQRLKQVYELLRKQHQKRGAISFKRLEARMKFDDAGDLIEISRSAPHYVHSMIEECMLAANAAAADFLIKHHAPAMFRVHAAPSMEKLQQVKQFLGLLKVDFTWKKQVSAKDYARTLDSICGRHDEQLINLILLRSMKQAVYSFKEGGHFALSYAHYLHFTSPIRRYPDLFNHRLIKLLLRHPRYFAGKSGAEKAKNYSLADGVGSDSGLGLARYCSMTERRADEAERNVVDWHKAKFISKYIGQSFKGVISGVANFGIFVELDGLMIEGLVHVSSLPEDYYRLEGTYQRLVGHRCGSRYCLGDQVEVVVAGVDLGERKINLELV